MGTIDVTDYIDYFRMRLLAKNLFLGRHQDFKFLTRAKSCKIRPIFLAKFFSEWWLKPSRGNSTV